MEVCGSLGVRYCICYGLRDNILFNFFLLTGVATDTLEGELERKLMTFPERKWHEPSWLTAEREQRVLDWQVGVPKIVTWISSR